MRKLRSTRFVAATILLCAIGTASGQAQNEANGSKSNSTATVEAKPKQSTNKALEPFRLDFSLIELENGKKINTRHYSLNLTAGSGNEIKIGTRVPVRTGPRGAPSTQFQYMDVGTNIWASLREVGDDLQLEVKADVSDLDRSSNPDTDLTPIVRQVKISGDTALVSGRPMLIGSVDDPNSNREFQLEVMATKLR